MNVAQIPFVPCFMQVTKASPGLPPQDAGFIPANPIWGPPMGAAEFDHNNPQPISVGIHIWSWFDGLVKKDGSSGILIDALKVIGIPGAIITPQFPNATTPIDAVAQIPLRSLQSHYQLLPQGITTDMTPEFVYAYNKGTLLCWGWLAICFK